VLLVARDFRRMQTCLKFWALGGELRGREEKIPVTRNSDLDINNLLGGKF